MAEVKKSKVLSRGEKARLAAKRRRDKESDEMSELVAEIPLDSDKLERENKCSILQVATAYLEIKEIVRRDMLELNGGNDEVWSSNENQEQQNIVNNYQESDERVTKRNGGRKNGSTNNLLPTGIFEGSLMLQALDGFLVFINQTGKILFVSEQVEDYLGLTQVNLIGRPVTDYIYGKDHEELFQHLVIQSSDEHSSPHHPDKEAVNQELGSSLQRSFYVRMKVSHKRPGTTVVKHGTLLTRWLGKLKVRRSNKNGGLKVRGLVAICQPIRSSAILEVRLEGNMFISRHDMGMKFIYCEQRIVRLIGYEPSDLIGRTAYHFHYPLDATKIQNCHSNLILKGCSTSKLYRFLGKTGDWVWMQTRASIVYNTHNQPQYVVCMNYVISPEEGERCLQFEQEQLGIKDPKILGCIDLPCNHSDPPQGEGEHNVKVVCDVNVDSVSMDTCLNTDVVNRDNTEGFMDVSFAIDSSASDTLLDEQGASSVTMATSLDPFLCSSSAGNTSILDSENRDPGLLSGRQFNETMEDMDILDDLLENIQHFPPIDPSSKIPTELSACPSMQLGSSLHLGFEDHSTPSPASPKDSTNAQQSLSKSEFSPPGLKSLHAAPGDVASRSSYLDSQRDSNSKAFPEEVASRSNYLNSQKFSRSLKSCMDSSNPMDIQHCAGSEASTDPKESGASNVLEIIESQAGLGSEAGSEMDGIESEPGRDSGGLHQSEKSLFSWMDDSVQHRSQSPGEALWSPQHLEGQRLSSGEIHKGTPAALQDIYESLKTSADSRLKEASTQPTTSLCPQSLASLLMTGTNKSSYTNTNLGVPTATKDSAHPEGATDTKEEKSSTQSMNSCHTSTDHSTSKQNLPSTSSPGLSQSSQPSHTEQNRFSNFTSGSLLRSLLYRGKSLDKEKDTGGSTASSSSSNTYSSTSFSSSSINSSSSFSTSSFSTSYSINSTSTINQTSSSSCSNLEHTLLSSPSIVVTPCSSPSSSTPQHSSSSSSSSSSPSPLTLCPKSSSSPTPLTLCPKSVSASSSSSPTPLILSPKSLSSSSSSLSSNSLSPSPSSTRSTTPVLPASNIPKSSPSQVLSSKYYTTCDSAPEATNSGKTLLSAVLSGTARLNIPTCKKDVTPGKDSHRPKSSSVSRCSNQRPHIVNPNLSGRRISGYRGHTCKAGFSSHNVSGLNLSGLVKNLSRISSDVKGSNHDLNMASTSSKNGSKCCSNLESRNHQDKQCFLHQNDSYRQCSHQGTQNGFHKHCHNPESPDGFHKQCFHRQKSQDDSCTHLNHQASPSGSQCSLQECQSLSTKQCSNQEAQSCSPKMFSSQVSQNPSQKQCNHQELQSLSQKQCSQQDLPNVSQRNCHHHDLPNLSQKHCSPQELPNVSKKQCNHHDFPSCSLSLQESLNLSTKQCSNGESQSVSQTQCSHQEFPSCSHQEATNGSYKQCLHQDSTNASNGSYKQCPHTESTNTSDGIYKQCLHPESTNASDDKSLPEESDCFSEAGLSWNDLPDDLLDVAMQYCESLGDEQTQALMDEFEHDLWSSANDLYNVTKATQDSDVTMTTDLNVLFNVTKATQDSDNTMTTDVNFEDKADDVTKATQDCNVTMTTDVNFEDRTNVLYNVAQDSDNTMITDVNSEDRTNVPYNVTKATQKSDITMTTDVDMNKATHDSTDRDTNAETRPNQCPGAIPTAVNQNKMDAQFENLPAIAQRLTTNQRPSLTTNQQSSSSTNQLPLFSTNQQCRYWASSTSSALTSNPANRHTAHKPCSSVSNTNFPSQTDRCYNHHHCKNCSLCSCHGDNSNDGLQSPTVSSTGICKNPRNGENMEVSSSNCDEDNKTRAANCDDNNSNKARAGNCKEDNKTRGGNWDDGNSNNDNKTRGVNCENSNKTKAGNWDDDNSNKTRRGSCDEQRKSRGSNSTPEVSVTRQSIGVQTSYLTSETEDNSERTSCARADMSELEKHLRGYKSTLSQLVSRSPRRDESRSTESPCRECENIARYSRVTPFLHKLLTGEISQDIYYQVDKHLIDNERRKRKHVCDD